MKNKDVLAALGAVCIAALLDQLKNGSQQSLIIQKLDSIMTKQERFDAILTQIDETTTDIAEDYAAFIEEVRAGNVSDDSLARAEASVATLKSIAAQKENPVPGGEVIPPADEEVTER